ncbi:MAG: enoyl-CoA hydratase/isomerase family protein [Pseudomonadales bacterium]|nr:enoyl-CoA hydratase/isomerase family protein [Pseudomonadales bacterium]
MEKVHFRINNNIGRISFDDAKANAMNPRFFKELHSALDHMEKHRVEVLVLSGRDNIFCAGLDLKHLATIDSQENARFTQMFARTMLRLFTFPIPTIAAVSGHAIAGGCILALPCDYRIVQSGEYRIQMNEIRNNMSVPNWMSLICAHSIPSHRLTEFVLHARAYTPDEAFRLEFMQECCEDAAQLKAAVETKVDDLRELDGKSYAITKKWTRNALAERALSHLKDIQAVNY